MNRSRRPLCITATILSVVIVLASCSGDSGDDDPAGAGRFAFEATGSTAPFTVGGAIEGIDLPAEPVVLDDARMLLLRSDDVIEVRHRDTGDVLDTFGPFGAQLYGVEVFDGDIVIADDEVVIIVDADSGQELRRFDVPAIIDGPFLVGDHWWFEGRDAFHVVDPTSGAVLDTITTNSGEEDPVIMGDLLVILQHGPDDSLSSIASIHDAGTRELIAEMPIGGFHAQPAVVGDELWVAVLTDAGDEVVIAIDPIGRRVVAEVPLSAPHDATSFGGFVWVKQIGDEHAVSVIDPERREVVQRLQFDGSVRDLATDGSIIAISVFDGEAAAELFVFDDAIAELGHVELPGRPTVPVVTDDAVWMATWEPDWLHVIAR